MPNGMEQGMMEQAGGEQQAPEEQMSPEQAVEENPQMKKEVEAFAGAISKLLHGAETKSKIYEMLKSAPPEKSIPEGAWLATSRVYEKLGTKGSKPSIEALFAGQLFATSELAEIGNAGKFFKEELNEENLKPIVQASLQRMIEEGVRGKIIDPIEFQEKIEPLLSDQQRQMGLEAGQRSGVPQEAGEGQAMEQYAKQAVDKERSMVGNKAAAQQRQQGMVQQASAQGGM